ncbi:hypothetical protein INR49_026322 [Caranx melampygus]|nr:hypothetical protein INR49_026322 [Caranx melampygus]
MERNSLGNRSQLKCLFSLSSSFNSKNCFRLPEDMYSVMKMTCRHEKEQQKKMSTEGENINLTPVLIYHPTSSLRFCQRPHGLSSKISDSSSLSSSSSSVAAVAGGWVTMDTGGDTDDTP